MHEINSKIAGPAGVRSVIFMATNSNGHSLVHTFYNIFLPFYQFTGQFETFRVTSHILGDKGVASTCWLLCDVVTWFPGNAVTWWPHSSLSWHAHWKTFAIPHPHFNTIWECCRYRIYQALTTAETCIMAAKGEKRQHCIVRSLLEKLTLHWESMESELFLEWTDHSCQDNLLQCRLR